MRRALPATLLLAITLAGCAHSGSPAPGQLPTVPADIQACFREQMPVKVPPRALTVAEVETLWKIDRVRDVALRKCGQRLIDWYNSLQAAWQ